MYQAGPANAATIEFLIMPNADIHSVKCSALPSTLPAALQLAADVSVTAIHDSEYVMYDLSQWRRAVNLSVDNLR
jgi:hypothetical protein